jgi:hypothetical protein
MFRGHVQYHTTTFPVWQRYGQNVLWHGTIKILTLQILQCRLFHSLVFVGMVLRVSIMLISFYNVWYLLVHVLCWSEDNADLVLQWRLFQTVWYLLVQYGAIVRIMLISFFSAWLFQTVWYLLVWCLE